MTSISAGESMSSGPDFDAGLDPEGWTILKNLKKPEESTIAEGEGSDVDVGSNGDGRDSVRGREGNVIYVNFGESGEPVAEEGSGTGTLRGENPGEYSLKHLLDSGELLTPEGGEKEEVIQDGSEIDKDGSAEALESVDGVREVIASGLKDGTLNPRGIRRLFNYLGGRVRKLMGGRNGRKGKNAGVGASSVIGDGSVASAGGEGGVVPEVLEPVSGEEIPASLRESKVLDGEKVDVTGSSEPSKNGAAEGGSSRFGEGVSDGGFPNFGGNSDYSAHTGDRTAAESDEGTGSEESVGGERKTDDKGSEPSGDDKSSGSSPTKREDNASYDGYMRDRREVEADENDGSVESAGGGETPPQQPESTSTTEAGVENAGRDGEDLGIKSGVYDRDKVESEISRLIANGKVDKSVGRKAIAGLKEGGMYTRKDILKMVGAQSATEKEAVAEGPKPIDKERERLGIPEGPREGGYYTGYDAKQKIWSMMEGEGGKEPLLSEEVGNATLGRLEGGLTIEDGGYGSVKYTAEDILKLIREAQGEGLADEVIGEGFFSEMQIDMEVKRANERWWRRKPVTKDEVVKDMVERELRRIKRAVEAGKAGEDGSVERNRNQGFVRWEERNSNAREGKRR
jgi:hypothetical protein